MANPRIDIDSGLADPIPSPISYLYTMDDVLDQINFMANSVSCEVIHTERPVNIHSSQVFEIMTLYGIVIEDSAVQKLIFGS